MNKKRILKALLLTMLFVGIGLLTNSKVYASYWGSVSDLKQTDATTTSITVSWSAASNASSYRVEIKERGANSTNYKVVGTVTGTSHTIKGLKKGKEYSVRVTPFSAQKEEGSSRAIHNAVTLADKIAKLKLDVWYTASKEFWIEWEQVDSASGYQIEIYNNKGKRVKKDTLTGYASSYTHKKVSNSKFYKVRLRAFMKVNGKDRFTKWQEVYCFAPPTMKSATISSGKLHVKWSKVAPATGYDIYVATSRNGKYKKVKSVSKKTTSTTVSKINKKKFNKNKTYYVYVVSKKKVKKVTYKSSPIFGWGTY